MNVDEYMLKHGLSEAMLDEMALPYENADFAHEENPVHHGSHYDAVGSKRVTVAYPSEVAQKVAALAHSRGVEPSEIYRQAVENYLAHA